MKEPICRLWVIVPFLECASGSGSLGFEKVRINSKFSLILGFCMVRSVEIMYKIEVNGTEKKLES